ncbi:hypothetical protein FA15DRAFT_670528 [Coprinopsis marcescibilis]|uniref:HNH nuclease domain-containing protein n=1 Tax=Coprinopsis marcescibilis TaxID=230819 RepID=A0A5C3KT33_COPMA|nr:hypothetical protein FA15DRAFT_670528 [Coprinopsis marcescibilis]
MQTNSNFDSTPESCIESDRRISAVSRVLAVDPNEGRCLVENCLPERMVEFCHVVPRKFWRDRQFLDSLEWYWRMRKNTLNLETRRNIFPASRVVHGLYDAGRWILVPEEAIIQRYRDALDEDTLRADRESFPLIPDSNRFEYRLVPVKDTEAVYFTRLNNPSIPMSLDAFTIHLPPFNTLPKLVSHVHPKFAIVSGGHQLSRMPPNDFDALKVRYPIVAKIFVAFRAWRGVVPTNAKSDPTYYPPYDPNDDHSSDEGNYADDPKDRDHNDAVTEKGRYHDSSCKRPRQLSPTASRSKTCNSISQRAHTQNGKDRVE